MQNNKVFTLGPVASNNLTIAPDVAALIKSHTLASHTYITIGCSCSFSINNLEINVFSLNSHHLNSRQQQNNTKTN